MPFTTPSKASKLPLNRALASAERKGPQAKKQDIDRMASDSAKSVSMVEIKEMLLDVMKDQNSMRNVITTGTANITSKIDQLLREDTVEPLMFMTFYFFAFSLFLISRPFIFVSQDVVSSCFRLLISRLLIFVSQLTSEKKGSRTLRVLQYVPGAGEVVQQG